MSTASGTTAGPVPEAELIGGRYRVVDVLGSGGHAEVFEVEDRQSERRLALKRLRAPPQEVTTARLQFRREFHVMAQLSHPRVVEVYDFGIDAGHPFYTMELLGGTDLASIGPISVDHAGRLVRDVASALALLHSRHFVHRDVSPGNVRCTDDDRAKLMDFGILATVGLCEDVAGTPPYVAPETLRGLPIDHRADLFALGAMAYWLLTGQKAFPARSLDDLEDLWQRPIVPPSRLNPEVPKGLDNLVRSLLSVDPLGRPQSAAEVIDRLAGAVGLAPAPELEVAHSYLTNSTLIGRTVELEQLRAHVATAKHGKGSVVLVEGPSGIGKSRLLHEARLEAQVSGLAVVVSGESRGKTPLGALQDLVDGVLEVAHDDAIEAARPHASVIARALPRLEPELGAATPAQDPGHERVRLQRALSEWFLDVSRRQPLVLIADDVQRWDESSAAVLTTLAHSTRDHPLLLLATIGTDEPTHAADAVANLRQAATRMRLRGLTAEDTEALVHTLFGKVPLAKKLAQWLFTVAGGNPMQYTAIPRQLVERGLIGYVEGEWVINEGFEAFDPPRALADAMDAKVAALTPETRALAECLSVLGGTISLELCVRLAEDDDEPKVFAALDELLFAEILVGSKDRFTFGHDGLRQALLRQLEPARARRLHLRVGQALGEAGRMTAEREGEVGRHLLEGGDARRGSQLLERTGRRLYQAKAFLEAIEPLEAALEVYVREDRNPVLQLELQSMLMLCGAMSDRHVVLRHGPNTIASCQRLAGLDVAQRVARFVGRVAGLLIGLAYAGARWLMTSKARRGPSPLDALRRLVTTVGYVTSSVSSSWPLEDLEKLPAVLEPVAISKKRIPYAAYLLAKNFVELRLGRFHSAGNNARAILSILDDDRRTSLAERDRDAGRVAALWALAVGAAWRAEGTYEESLVAVGRLGTRFADSARLQLTVLWHRLRGEEDRARSQEEAAEVLMIQAGSGWLFQQPIVCYSSIAYGFLGDVLGLKRCIAALDRMQRDGFEFEFFLELARGEYHRERGELEEAEEALRRALAASTSPCDRALAHAALADTLLASGELEEARAMAQEGQALNEDPELELLPLRVRCGRALALAEAALGNLPSAALRLERLQLELSQLAPYPATLGLVAEARARVAYRQRKWDAFRRFADEAGRLFRATHNPTLVGRLGRLPGAPGEDDEPIGADHDVIRSVAVTTDARADLFASIRAAQQEVKGQRERAVRALELMLQATSADEGFLYLLKNGDHELVAAIPAQEPPQALALAIGAGSTPAPRLVVDWSEGSRSPASWRIVQLKAVVGPDETEVGVAAVASGALPFDRPPGAFARQIAKWLVESGDVAVEPTPTT